MAAQEGTSGYAGNQQVTTNCEKIGEVLSLITDKWTLLVVRVLAQGPRRFNALRREVGTISQKVLAGTLRDLEKNGLVSRAVLPMKPPQVEYALTELGTEFLDPIETLSRWVVANRGRIEASRDRFAERSEG